MACSTSYKLI